MDEEQLGTWLACREGKATASRMNDLHARLKPPKVKEGEPPKKGEPAQKRIDYMYDLVVERAEAGSVRHYVSPAMEWGLEMECAAKEAYEMATGNIVRDSWFYDHPRIDLFGATPDGEIAGGGLIETKCPTTPKFVRWVIADEVPEEHRLQMIAQCACTGRQWVDFVAYDPRVKRGPNLLIKRFTPTAAEIAALEAEVEEFLVEVDKLFDMFVTRKAA